MTDLDYRALASSLARAVHDEDAWSALDRKSQSDAISRAEALLRQQLSGASPASKPRDTSPAGSEPRSAELGQDSVEVAADPSGPGTPDDRWGYRAKHQALLDRFGTPGDGLEAALEGLADALLREARYHATWPVATAEKWRYDRMLWVFGVMLGEIPADSPAPPADDPYDPEG